MTIFYRIFRTLIKNPFVENRIGRVLLIALALNFIFGGLFYLAERDVNQELTFFDALWWAMVTMTTVGYGDYYAQTPLGRFIISYPCMLFGIGIIGYLVGVVAENMIDRISRKKRGLMQITLKDHIIICNYPHPDKVSRVIDELVGSPGYQDTPFVLVTDKLEALPDELSGYKIKFVNGDPVREDILMKANVKECAGVFILAENPGHPSSDSKTFAIGTQIEMIGNEFNKSIRTVVELVSTDNLKMMQRSRVDGIVSSDGILDGLMVQEFLYPGVHDIIHQIITNKVGSQFYILDTRLDGYKISDIQMSVLKHPSNLQVIGISRGQESILNPSKDEIIKPDDRLIMLAEKPSDFEMIEASILQGGKGIE